MQIICVTKCSEVSTFRLFVCTVCDSHYCPSEVNIFSKARSTITSHVSKVVSVKRRLLSGKLWVSHSITFKLVEFQLSCDNQMAAILLRLAFLSLLPQGMCPGVCFYKWTCIFCFLSTCHIYCWRHFTRERQTARVSKFRLMFVEKRLRQRRFKDRKTI